MIEPLRKDVLTVTVKIAKEICTLATSSELAVREFGKLKKEREFAIKELVEPREGSAYVEYKQDVLRAKLHRAKRVRDKYTDAVNSAQSGVGDLQELVAKDASALQEHMGDHWVCMCQHLRALLVERVLEACEDQTRDAGRAVGLYVEKWKTRLKRIWQLFQDPARTEDVLVEKLWTGSESANNGSVTNCCDDWNSAGAGTSFA